MGTIFSAYDIRGVLNESLNVEDAWMAGKAFAEWLPDEGSVIVVRSESASEPIARGFVEGLLLQGRNAVDAGIGDQAVASEALRELRAAGAVVVSHDGAQNLEVISLYDVNGVAVTSERGLLEVEELIAAGNFLPAADKGEVTQYQ